MSESPANDLPPKYEDLLRVDQAAAAAGEGAGAATQSAAPSALPGGACAGATAASLGVRG